jgi:hypothetical protein
MLRFFALTVLMIPALLSSNCPPKPQTPVVYGVPILETIVEDNIGLRIVPGGSRRLLHHSGWARAPRASAGLQSQGARRQYRPSSTCPGHDGLGLVRTRGHGAQVIESRLFLGHRCRAAHPGHGRGGQGLFADPGKHEAGQPHGDLSRRQGRHARRLADGSRAKRRHVAGSHGIGGLALRDLPGPRFHRAELQLTGRGGTAEDRRVARSRGSPHSRQRHPHPSSLAGRVEADEQADGRGLHASGHGALRRRAERLAQLVGRARTPPTTSTPSPTSTASGTVSTRPTRGMEATSRSIPWTP